MQKKLQIAGYVLFLSGTILFGFMHLAIALYQPHLGGWSSPPGKIATLLNQIDGWVPYVLSILFLCGGGCLILYDLWFSEKKER